MIESEIEERLLLSDAYLKPHTAMPFLYGEGGNGKSQLTEHITLIASNKEPEVGESCQINRRVIKVGE